MKDFKKGERDGYSNKPKPIPKSFEEAMGQSAGLTRRQRELQDGDRAQLRSGRIWRWTLLLLVLAAAVVLLLILAFAF